LGSTRAETDEEAAQGKHALRQDASLLMVVDRTQRAFAAFANIPYEDPFAQQELLRLLDDADAISVANCWTTRLGARPLRRDSGTSPLNCAILEGSMSVPSKEAVSGFERIRQ
jgi:hypothetical protein